MKPYTEISSLDLYGEICDCRDENARREMADELSKRSGDSTAVSLLGNCFLFGQGRRKCITHAIHLLKRGCAMGSGPACAIVGYNYHVGEFSQQNLLLAIFYYKRTVRLRDPDNSACCAENLASIFCKLGQERKAQYWGNRAVELAHESQRARAK